MSKYVFGIDLGMEYSRIAYVDDKGVPRIIRNLEGESVNCERRGNIKTWRNNIIGKRIDGEDRCCN